MFVSKYSAKIKLIMFPKIKREVNDLLSLSLTPTLFYLLIFYFALKKGEKVLKIGNLVKQAKHDKTFSGCRQLWATL